MPNIKNAKDQLSERLAALSMPEEGVRLSLADLHEMGKKFAASMTRLHTKEGDHGGLYDFTRTEVHTYGNEYTTGGAVTVTLKEHQGQNEAMIFMSVTFHDGKGLIYAEYEYDGANWDRYAYD